MYHVAYHSSESGSSSGITFWEFSKKNCVISTTIIFPKLNLIKFFVYKG